MRIALLILACALAQPLAAQPFTFAPPSNPPTNHEIAVSIATDSAVYTVQATGSMKPTFDETWLLLVQRKAFADLRIGDIILYRAPDGITFSGQANATICHRVWGTSSGHSVVLTKGDANWQVDPVNVTETMYVGTVVGLVRRPRAQTP